MQLYKGSGMEELMDLTIEFHCGAKTVISDSNFMKQ
jgi:hypothetical protein